MDMSLFIKMLVGHLFLSTGISKIMNLSAFEEAVHQYTRIGHKVVLWFLSRLITVLEMGCAIILILGILTYYAEITTILLLLLFTILVSLHLMRKTELTCHCGGILGNEDLHWGIPVRNMILIIALIWTIEAPSTPLIERVFHGSQIGMIISYEVLILSIGATYYLIRKANVLLKTS